MLNVMIMELLQHCYQHDFVNTTNISEIIIKIKGITLLTAGIEIKCNDNKMFNNNNNTKCNMTEIMIMIWY